MIAEKDESVTHYEVQDASGGCWKKALTYDLAEKEALRLAAVAAEECGRVKFFVVCVTKIAAITGFVPEEIRTTIEKF